MGDLLPLNNLLPESMPSSSPDPVACPSCGETIYPIYLELLRKWVMPSCHCVVLAQETELARLRDDKRKRRVENLFALSQLGVRFTECTFDTWKPRPGTEKMLAAAVGFMDNLSVRMQDGRGLLFFGPAGTGKTHLAASIVNEIVRQGKPAIFQSVPALLAKIRSTFGRGENTEGQILNALNVADVVVLDDAGTEKWSDWTEMMLYTIIDERYRQKRPLIITTNCGLEELEDHLGFRTMDRLVEMCEMVPVLGDSYRRERARRKE